ncbi:MAG: Ig-like domain-containing protein, partial [Thaumarchaeota archaeon]|nr:Ig-like domain-containing protein [Nitrososphaerota archaeon]
SSGTAEIAVLADEIPLSKFDVPVTSYAPVISIDSADHADNNSPLTATVTATYNQLPLAGLNVDWSVTGATTKNADTITDKEGKATISLITNDPSTVSIEAGVGGGPYQTVTVDKQVSINPPLQPLISTGQSGQSNSQSSGFTVMGVSPLLFIIPGAAAAAFVVLKKKQMLDGITEKINITDRFSEIKERMMDSGQR